jgi:hypothetical protein
MKHIENTNSGIIHIRNNQTGKSVDLNPGLNHLDEEKYSLIESHLHKHEGLRQLESLNDTPDLKEPEALESPKEPEEPKAPASKPASKSERKAARKLESLNE